MIAAISSFVKGRSCVEALVNVGAVRQVGRYDTLETCKS